MKKVFLQYWEESEIGNGIIPDGCSLHISKEDCLKYVESIYTGRSINMIPPLYDKKAGEPVSVEIKSELYDLIAKDGLLRIDQVSLVNLIKLEELLP